MVGECPTSSDILPFRNVGSLTDRKTADWKSLEQVPGSGSTYQIYFEKKEIGDTIAGLHLPPIPSAPSTPYRNLLFGCFCKVWNVPK